MFIHCDMLVKRTIDFGKVSLMANILKTIAHPIRLEVLMVLEKEEPLSVSDIKERIDIDVEQSLLSHHLVKMKDRGVLQSRKEGKFIMYSICNREILHIFDCMENCNLS